MSFFGELYKKEFRVDFWLVNVHDALIHKKRQIYEVGQF